MSREIKFRAWGKRCGMHYWKLGSGLDNSVFFREAESVMQYTGLKDKNGLEVYEGDKVKVFNGSEGEVITTVVWCEHGWRFKRPDGDTWHLWQWDEDETGIEVVGNIYETSELLK